MIPIAASKNNGEYVVRNMLPLRGNKNPINEKQAGHTPSTNPNVLPPNPAFTLGLQSMHLFFE